MTVIDLSTLDGTNGFRLDGINAGDYSGRSVSGAGDLNGDGFADLIVGAFRADPTGGNNAGESYVVFGKASGFTAAVELASLDGADGFRLDGIDADDSSGRSVSGAGDVNGDGFADLIVGARDADPNGDSYAGESYVVFGFDSGAVTHQGTSAAETLTGDGGANVIIGDQGDDVLIGGGGADALRGGEGDDILDVTDLGFRRIDGGAGADTLRLAGAGLSLDLTAVGDQGLSGIEAIDLAGAGAEATLDRLSLLNLSDTTNSLTVSGNTSARVTLADTGWSLSADNGTSQAFANGAASIVIGSAVTRNVTGSAAADTLLGGDGDDILAGGAGDDSLTGGGGFDTADYSDAASLISINLSGGAAQDGDGGADTLTSIENVIGTDFNDVLISDDAVNTLTGGAGGDRLDGRGGDDVMIGGAGNDIYTVTDTGDAIIELVGEGTDRINAFVDFTNPDNVELLVGKFASVGLTLTGNGTRDQITGANKINSPDAIFGLGGNDLLVGLVGDDVIDGGAGNDRIFGNSGADVISGGLGNDRITGQQGADTFVHVISDGRDRITDFNVAQDLLDLTGHGFSNFAEVQALMSDVAGDALIDLAGSDSVLLQGVAFASIGSEDVLI